MATISRPGGMLIAVSRDTSMFVAWTNYMWENRDDA
jgi:hypothetical protein